MLKTFTFALHFDEVLIILHASSAVARASDIRALFSLILARAAFVKSVPYINEKIY